MPFLLFLKPVGAFLKAIPWQVYASIALLIVLLILRSHYIGVGVERCQATQAKAQAKALVESAKQEKQAPVIAKDAFEAVKPKIETRIRVIRENIPVNSCPDYGDIVQSEIHKAAAGANRVR